MILGALYGNAMLAGAAIAAAAGLLGYFVVIRSQVLAGDALSHVAFTGTIAAALAGVDVRIGLFAAVASVALLFGGLSERLQHGDVAIGVVFAWVLGLGALCLELVQRSSRGVDGAISARTLFGSVFGLTSTDVAIDVAISASVIVVGIVIARPLLFATIAPGVASARGVPIRLLGTVLLVLVAATAGEATQAVGSLLFLALLAVPAGAALRLTSSPIRGLILSMGFAVTAMVGGVGVAVLWPSIPPSSAVCGIAVGIYAAAMIFGSATVRARAVQHHVVARNRIP